MITPKFNMHPKVALLTKHGKEQIIEPILHSSFGIHIFHTDKFDTDTLGTFDHRIPRTLSPIDAALKKAYLACEISGLTQGLGSEGSFNTHITGATANHEVLAFVDLELKLEVIGFARNFIRLQGFDVKNEIELAEKMQPFIDHYGSEQKWLLAQNGAWQKGLQYTELLSRITAWPCTIEPDFRAMNCPARQDTIALATKDLVKCLKSHCPKCAAVNFVEKYKPEQVSYLPCEVCGSRTTQHAPILPQCDSCGFTEQSDEVQATASPMYCTFCNP